jgi:hypothetical protein
MSEHTQVDGRLSRAYCGRAGGRGKGECAGGEREDGSSEATAVAVSGCEYQNKMCRWGRTKNRAVGYHPGARNGFEPTRNPSSAQREGGTPGLPWILPIAVTHLG